MTVSINSPTITEGNNGTKTMSFTVARTGSTSAFDVNYSTSNGSATVSDGDYSFVTGTLHFDANVNSQTISVTINGDTKAEADEFFFVLLSDATNGITISNGVGVGTIVNDDSSTSDDYAGDTTTIGQLAVNTSTVGNIEMAGDRDWFGIQLVAGVQYAIGLQGSNVNAGTLSDPYLSLYSSTGQLLAADNDSWGFSSSRIVFTPASSGTYYIGAGAFNDAATGTYTASVTGGPMAAGSVSINNITPPITEGDSGTKLITFSISRTGGTAPFNVNYTTNDGSATATDGDYIATSGTLSFGTNVNSQVISVTINGDTKFEFDEFFTVVLSGFTNGVTSNLRTEVGQISNDDPAPINLQPTITSNGGGDAATISILENSSFVTNVQGSDPDGSLIAYSIAGGADASFFQISALTGALSFITPPNFEAPTDSDGNNSYLVIVRASDGTLAGTQTLTVNVTNANEPPIIISNGGGDTENISVAENTTAVTTVVATDPDAGAALSYAIIGGADAGKFAINASTGVLAFVAAPDFENPADSDHNNSYIVQVRASDGSLSDTQTVTVNVTDVNDPPPSSPSLDVNAAPSADFDGNGRSDLLWRNDAGQIAVWQTNSSGVLSSAVALGSAPASAHIEGTGDFNQDGRGDILFRSVDQTLAVWQTNGQQLQSINVLGSASAAWHSSGIGDFNGDGTSDLLFRNDNGQIAQWIIDNNHIQSIQLLGSTSSAFHIVGISDFNGDGKADLLFRDNAGVLASWLLDGNQLQSAQAIGSTSIDWHLVGMGDFNGDGKNDLLWHNDNGQIAEWLMNGATIQSVQAVGSAGTQFHVEGTGDFNGDGRSDILFRDDTGAAAEWLTNGATTPTAQVLGSAPVDYHISSHHFDLV
jgi:hypothetical protein